LFDIVFWGFDLCSKGFKKRFEFDLSDLFWIFLVPTRWGTAAPPPE
jgi:hypothetical protein